MTFEQWRQDLYLACRGLLRVKAFTGTAVARNVPEPSRIRPVGRHDDSRRSVVIIEESTKTLATANPTHALRRRRTVDEFVPEPLVIALAMIVLHELGEGSS